MDNSTMHKLSPVRNSSTANNSTELAEEQLHHFGIKANSDFGKALLAASEKLYQTSDAIQQLEALTEALSSLPNIDRISRFNAKKFLCFQLAKLIDMLQPSMKATYQSLDMGVSSRAAKGDYPLFANVGALFSATPAVVKTATYLYACTEWVEDAFTGRESTHPIYSRLLNPTSIALANTVTALEAGEHASDYMTWNFNSGMAAIDALLSNQLRHGDVLLSSRNVYGGSFQLMQDFYARSDRLNVQLEWFDGFTEDEFKQKLDEVEKKYQKQLKQGKKVLVYLESPCNPHGNMLDVPAICQLSHDKGHLVALDSTLATPFLSRPLRQKEKSKRPDWVIHSYTKDISGSGSATAGGIIGENKRMFLPKSTQHDGISWENTLFWDVYYIKGAFLDADKALDVMNGLKTLEGRMLTKCINTLVFSRYLDSHPLITVNSHALENHHNSKLREKLLYLGLPSPLFSIDMEKAGIPREAFVRFFDSLEPAFGHMVSLGQSNTLILCPALTSHSEMDETAQKDAGIYLTTIRIAMGDENPIDLIQHFKACIDQFIDPVQAGFSNQFMFDQQLEKLYQEIYLEIHQKHIEQS
ncbi:Cys/Met metabolism pyridoxal-phosphate-dependent enzyme [Endozoicomonas sp. OPT23]|uniref:trans-sulfuration enzyme family protein n=1 Tax=Endozoicomonas sp. OPT23 TaxID=2072845 RepID=UPI00129A0C0B|nr:aminotransferase class I/II-fold pyridoxal phosphate-dependent enzyme [Endozoicomonas sp. OPT23]MRI35277.1 Cys/Met metabolism pyridoxal-phosphate-dependent enzyme [Endozoicomonas sp. OPT23]